MDICVHICVIGPSPLSDFSVKKYNPKDFKFPEGKKAFPMRPGHFFCGIDNACRYVCSYAVSCPLFRYAQINMHNSCVHVHEYTQGLRMDSKV